MNINFSNMIKQSIPFFVVVAIAYVLNSVLFLVLPKSGVDFEVKKDIALEYRKFTIKKLFKEKEKQSIKVVKKVNQEYKLLSNITLKAVYAINAQKAWIIIANKAGKTFILSVDEDHKGYKLIKVQSKYVIFEKANQEYKVELLKDKLNYSIKKMLKDSPKVESEIIVLDDKVSVQRAYLNSYINNFEKIWKDITIIENKNKNGDIDGFKVTRVKAKSTFAKLGLEKGDIIKSINNIILRSYNDAFSIYKKINKIKDLNILILRNGREMELNYEIK